MFCGYHMSEKVSDFSQPFCMPGTKFEWFGSFLKTFWKQCNLSKAAKINLRILWKCHLITFLTSFYTSLTHRERRDSGPGQEPGRLLRSIEWDGLLCRCDHKEEWCASLGARCPEGGKARGLLPGLKMWPGLWGFSTSRFARGGRRRRRSILPSPEDMGRSNGSLRNFSFFKKYLESFKLCYAEYNQVGAPMLKSVKLENQQPNKLFDPKWNIVGHHNTCVFYPRYCISLEPRKTLRKYKKGFSNQITQKSTIMVTKIYPKIICQKEKH